MGHLPPREVCMPPTSTRSMYAPYLPRSTWAPYLPEKNASPLSPQEVCGPQPPRKVHGPPTSTICRCAPYPPEKYMSPLPPREVCEPPTSPRSTWAPYLCDKWRGDEKGRNGANPRHCHNKEKENGWPHPPTTERKIRPYSNVLSARRRQKKEGRVKKTWRSTFKEEMGVSRHGARRIASDRERWHFSSLDATRGTRGSKSK